MRLQDKIALVTSGETPCGRAIAIGFAREGAHCVVLDDKHSERNSSPPKFASLGRRALALQFDVTKKPEIEEGVRRAVAEFGRIDVLLNCSALNHKVIS